MTWSAVLVALVYASAIAWFVDVLIARVPGAEPLLARPRCPHCARALAWYEQFPVLSRLLARARCRACGADLGWRYAVAELLCFVAALAITASHLQGMVRVAWLLYVPVAVALAFIDLEHKRLPDRLTLPAAGGVLLLLAVDAVAHGFAPLWRALLGAVLLFLTYLAMNLLTRGGMGMGDVKLALSIGALTGYLGWDAVVYATLGAFLIGGLVSAFLLATRRAGRTATMPFGPFMLVGAFVAPFLVQIDVACLLGYVTCV